MKYIRIHLIYFFFLLNLFPQLLFYLILSVFNENMFYNQNTQAI